jgi:hypothetical protein
VFTRVNKVPVNSTRASKLSSAEMSRAPCVIGKMRALDDARHLYFID